MQDHTLQILRLRQTKNGQNVGGGERRKMRLIWDLDPGALEVDIGEHLRGEM
jgi:hypothetical protein